MAHVTRIPRYGIIPDGEIVHLKYYETFVMDVVAGAPQIYAFRLNSLFDPNLTGVGHQPNGRDQLALLYGKYIVYKTEWRITACNNNFATDNVDHSAHVIQIAYNGNSTGLTPDQMMENNSAMKVDLSPMGSGGERKTWKGKCTLAALAGVEKDEYYSSDDIYGATMAANPNADMTLQFTGFNYGAVNQKISFEILLIYHAKVYQQLLLTSS